MESINYLESHDNYTLWDQIVKSQNHSVEKGHYRDFNEENILDNFMLRKICLELLYYLLLKEFPLFNLELKF